MITFKQKQFNPAAAIGLGSKLLGGAGNAVMIGSGLLGVKQGAAANEAQEEANRKQLREMKRHNEAMEEAAEKNPALASAVERTFAAINTKSMIDMAKRGYEAVGKTQLGGLAKDFLGTQGGNIKKAAGIGASIATTTYLGNRLATSIKDHKENDDKGNKNFLKKAGLTAAVVGSGILGAKRGLMGKSAQTFMTSGAGGNALRAAGKALNPIVRDDKTGKISKAGTAMKVGLNGMFIAGPTVSYLTQKKAEKDMVGNTQKDFSVASMWSHLRKNPSRAITGGINKVSSFFGMYGQGGTAAVQNTGQKLLEAGQKSGNKFSKAIGEWITKKDAAGNLVNAGKANLLATAGTVTAGGLAMKAGSAAVKVPTKVLDRDAYKMEEQQNDKV